MNDYRDGLELAAERGHRIGAAALLERIATAPVEHGQPAGAVPPRRGLAIAAAVFVLVLAAGIALGIAFRPEPDVADVPEIELIQSHEGTFAAGPGGFVRRAGGTFEFSPDGHTWTPFSLPRGPEDDRPVQTIGLLTPQATDDLWIIEGAPSSSGGVWLSSDGQTWTSVQWDEPLASMMDTIIAMGPGFLGMVRPDDVPIEFLWSTDGVSWTPVVPPPGVDRRSFRAPIISRAGITWVETGNDGIRRLIHSADGVSWTGSDLDFTVATDEPEELAPALLNRIAGRWIYVPSLRSRRGVVDEWTAQVWTSDDFVDWKYQGVPTFSVRTERPRGAGPTFDIGELLLSAPLIRGGPGGRTWTGEIWATTDGEAWTKVAEGLGELHHLAGRKNPDGTYTVLYFPAESAE